MAGRRDRCGPVAGKRDALRRVRKLQPPGSPTAATIPTPEGYQQGSRLLLSPPMEATAQVTQTSPTAAGPRPSGRGICPPAQEPYQWRFEDLRRGRPQTCPRREREKAAP